MGSGGSPAISATSSMATGLSVPAAHIQTVGVRRRGYGSSGTAVQVLTNHFVTDIPKDIIYHYNGMLSPGLLCH